MTNEGETMVNPELELEWFRQRCADLDDALALRDAGIMSLCIALHGHVILDKSIYDLVNDAAELVKRLEQKPNGTGV